MNQYSKASPYAIDGNRELLRKESLVFLILATVLSWSGGVWMMLRVPPGFERGKFEAVRSLFGSWPMLFGCGPLIAAIIVTAVTRGKAGTKELLAKVIRWRVRPVWFLVALLLPIVPQWIGLFTWSHFTGASLILPGFGDYFASWLQIALIGALYFVTEELGWRGFLLPRVLAGFRWQTAALVVGVIWAVWHYPIWVLESWAMSEPLLDTSLSLLVSSLRAIAISVLLTWIYLNTSGSVLLAMLFHGSNDANFGKIFEVAGDSALQGPFFLAVQSCATVILATLVLFVTRNRAAPKIRGETEELVPN
jgi:membrane protease YdiL (CAAX protease family)